MVVKSTTPPYARASWRHPLVLLAATMVIVFVCAEMFGASIGRTSRFANVGNLADHRSNRTGRDGGDGNACTRGTRTATYFLAADSPFLRYTNGRYTLQNSTCKGFELHRVAAFDWPGLRIQTLLRLEVQSGEQMEQPPVARPDRVEVSIRALLHWKHQLPDDTAGYQLPSYIHYRSNPSRFIGRVVAGAAGGDGLGGSVGSHSTAAGRYGGETTTVAHFTTEDQPLNNTAVYSYPFFSGALPMKCFLASCRRNKFTDGPRASYFITLMKNSEANWAFGFSRENFVEFFGFVVRVSTSRHCVQGRAKDGKLLLTARLTVTSPGSRNSSAMSEKHLSESGDGDGMSRQNSPRSQGQAVGRSKSHAALQVQPSPFWPRGSFIVSSLPKTRWLSTTAAAHRNTMMARSRPRLEIIGDSLTCGYANSCKDHRATKAVCSTWWLADFSRTWGQLTCDATGADCEVLCWSGFGVLRNCCGGLTTIPQLYDRALATAGRLHQSYERRQRNGFIEESKNKQVGGRTSSRRPDAVLINLGTNDHVLEAWGSRNASASESAAVLDVKPITGLEEKCSNSSSNKNGSTGCGGSHSRYLVGRFERDFINAYVEFVRRIDASYEVDVVQPRHRTLYFLVCGPFTNDYCPAVQRVIAALRIDDGSSHRALDVRLLDHRNLMKTKSMSCCGHPDISVHRKMAQLAVKALKDADVGNTRS